MKKICHGSTLTIFFIITTALAACNSEDLPSFVDSSHISKVVLASKMGALMSTATPAKDNLNELLNELRVALPGVQVLFAFLLVAPFNQRFATVSRFERDLYFATLLLTLLASVLALPILTRFLPKAEFGLWSQLLALNALAIIADFGMSAVFLRRITAGRASPLVPAAAPAVTGGGATGAAASWCCPGCSA